MKQHLLVYIETRFLLLNAVNLIAAGFYVITHVATLLQNDCKRFKLLPRFAVIIEMQYGMKLFYVATMHFVLLVQIKIHF